VILLEQKYRTDSREDQTTFTTIPQTKLLSKRLKKFGCNIKIRSLLTKEEMRSLNTPSRNGAMQKREWKLRYKEKKSTKTLGPISNKPVVL
jgi:hypothetical protein